MSRRKQQNPKPLSLKCDSMTEEKDEISSTGYHKDINNLNEKAYSSHSLSSNEDSCPNQAVESPEQREEIKKELDEGQEEMNLKIEPQSPERESTMDIQSLGLENKLGIPEEAPLRVEISSNGEYTILTSKRINRGAGLDPLKAQKVESPEDPSELETNKHLVSFMHGENKVYFLLDSSINCGWLKCLGAPTEERLANLRIYFVGGQLWVEVIKNLEENEQLVAEFFDEKKNIQKDATSTEKPASASPSTATGKTDVQFPCTLCGVVFRNPHTLQAHRKHYCSKATTAQASSNHKAEILPSPSGSDNDKKEMESPQAAYMCKVCQFMTLTKADIEAHVRDKHRNFEMEASASASPNSEKTYCADCDIHFKKSESYMAHKLHYCKSKEAGDSISPRSDIESSKNTQSKSSSPKASIKDLYKKVSFFDNQIAASQAAAVAAAGSLSLSLLSLPALAALPMMPLKWTPALMAQALQSVVKANPALATASGTMSETETPLDLTAGSKKRPSDSDSQTSPPVKKRVMLPSPASATAGHSASSTPIPAAAIISGNSLPMVNGHGKPTGKSEKPTCIYRCESCSIPFYKRENYEAHKLHYCSQRLSSKNSSDNEVDESEKTTPKQLSPKQTTSTTTTGSVDDRLVITYTCNKCSTSYRTMETFKAHQCAITTEPTATLLHCDECSFKATSKQSLLEHMENHQKSAVAYKCLLCGYHGNTMRGMRQHGRQHMLNGEEFLESDVITIDQMPAIPQKVTLPTPIRQSPIHSSNMVDEELLRLKNEPYKKRRSRKHYQKSEFSQMSPQRKENIVMNRPPSSNSQNGSSMSPLHNSSSNKADSRTPSPSSTKSEAMEQSLPTLIPIVSHIPDIKPAPVKNFVCSCNASFASERTYEAHKKHYCPHKKASLSPNPTITVTH